MPGTDCQLPSLREFDEIPDAILEDRAADAARDVPQLDDLARRAQPRRRSSSV